jgi:type II secretory pathway pseudopilin PulG
MVQMPRRPTAERNPGSLVDSSTCSDRGASMIEILISVLLMGIAVSTILPALWVSVRASQTSDSQAEVMAVLSDAANRLSRSGWVICPESDATGGYEAQVDAAASEKGWGPDAVEVTTIMYWDPSTESWTPDNALVAGGCSGADDSITPDQTLQRVTVTASTPDGRFTRVIEVILGDMTGQIASSDV